MLGGRAVAYRLPGRSTRVAKECRLSSALAGNKCQGLKRRSALAVYHQSIDGGDRLVEQFLLIWYLNEIHTPLRQASFLGSLPSSVKERGAGEENFAS